MFGVLINRLFDDKQKSAVRSVLEGRQLCCVPGATLGGDWAVSYNSGPQRIFDHSYVAAYPLALADFRFLFSRRVYVRIAQMLTRYQVRT